MFFQKRRRKRFEGFLKKAGYGDIDLNNMVCSKCGEKIKGSWVPIGNGKVRCSKCWDWL